MKALFDLVERLSIIAADLVLVPILALCGVGRAVRAARAPAGSGGAQAAPDSRPSARPNKTSTT
jgi:hypothetical protein